MALAQGMARAAVLGVYVCGGNLSRGPLNIGVSVHGEVDRQRVLLRSGGAAGHGLYVTGPLGGAAACVRTRQMVPADPKALTPLQQAYYRPLARCDLAADLGLVAAGMDISDGLAQDLGHLCRASGCGAALDSSAIPGRRRQRLTMRCSAATTTNCCWRVSTPYPMPSVSGISPMALR